MILNMSGRVKALLEQVVEESLDKHRTDLEKYLDKNSWIRRIGQMRTDFRSMADPDVVKIGAETALLFEKRVKEVLNDKNLSDEDKDLILSNLSRARNQLGFDERIRKIKNGKK